MWNAVASQVAEVKSTPANARDLGLFPGSGRSPGEGNSNLFQNSCLENPLTEEPARLQSMGWQRGGQDWVTEYAHMIWNVIESNSFIYCLLGMLWLMSNLNFWLFINFRILWILVWISLNVYHSKNRLLAVSWFSTGCICFRKFPLAEFYQLDEIKSMTCQLFLSLQMFSSMTSHPYLQLWFIDTRVLPYYKAEDSFNM